MHFRSASGVLRYCTTELLTKNAFHVMLKAAKSVFDKLRQRTGLTGDGAALVDATLAIGRSGTPRLETALAALIKGLVGMYRNPVAHDPCVPQFR